MDFQDVTTEELCAELARRYNHMAMVGVPKDGSDQGLFLSGDKRVIDNLMAEFIAGRFSLAFSRREGMDGAVTLDTPKTQPAPVDLQIQSLVVALGKTFGEMIVAGIPKDKPDTDEFNVLVQPPPPHASPSQLRNLHRIRERINTMPLPPIPD